MKCRHRVALFRNNVVFLGWKSLATYHIWLWMAKDDFRIDILDVQIQTWRCDRYIHTIYLIISALNVSWTRSPGFPLIQYVRFTHLCCTHLYLVLKKHKLSLCRSAICATNGWARSAKPLVPVFEGDENYLPRNDTSGEYHWHAIFHQDEIVIQTYLII